jgi:hypothetical protein
VEEGKESSGILQAEGEPGHHSLSIGIANFLLDCFSTFIPIFLERKYLFLHMQ